MEIVSSPYKKGFLDVGDGHKLYFELCGNPEGKPILYLHGGPGSGFSENSKKYFNPKVWNIILFDQRGSGRSTPFASLEHNTTNDLVEDINKLLRFLHIEKVTLFGGSWGSTLALIYAIRNPQKIRGLLLRGIFIPSKEDNTYFFGGGVRPYFPETWERFISTVPKEQQHAPAAYYFEKMKHGTKEEKEKYTYEWAYYELSLLKLKSNHKEIEEGMKEYSYQSLSPLEAHYLLQNCFVPEGYIWKNIEKIKHIPTVIVHGRYDMICQPMNAYLLYKNLPNSQLFFVIGGHSDSQTKRKLTRETAKMYFKI